VWPQEDIVVEPTETELVYFDFDLVLVLGGDGTFVRACRALPGVDTIGFHGGTLGFLTPHDPEDAVEALKAYFWHRRFTFSPRQTLMVSMPGQLPTLAINDVVLQRPIPDPVMAFAVQFQDEGETIDGLRADGLIISSATGSTAYSMSAGGSILHPMLKANIITPICPLSSGFRSLAYPSERELKVRVPDDRNGVRAFHVSIDGETRWLVRGETITISPGPELRVIRIDGCQHFVQSVQSKLGWAR
jgi:NAD+ kinase